MRQKRAKAYKKRMNMYSTVFGFREPYQVLGTNPHVCSFTNRQYTSSKRQWIRISAGQPALCALISRITFNSSFKVKLSQVSRPYLRDMTTLKVCYSDYAVLYRGSLS